MRKVPTVFVRDPDDRRHVLSEVTPGCEWVLAGEGVPTRKYDGTCVMLDPDGGWWARREVKPGRAAPAAFVAVETDGVTGKTFGWEPVEASGFARWLQEARDGAASRALHRPGTYELCGPRINGNPEGFGAHVLIFHADAEPVAVRTPVTFASLRSLLTGGFAHEGIVWHHPDGRMAKLKRRDFPCGSGAAGG
jgi:hypothetical protein